MLEILGMLPDERRDEYRVDTVGKEMQTVVIDGNEFTDYGAFSFIREKSYFDEPTRSADGVISNLDNYATFTTPHLTINFSLLSIDSYRTLMNLIYTKNEFRVTCYDIVQNKRVTERMYFATEEMPKIFAIARAYQGEKWLELLGVQDYTVEMIGTNADVEKVKVNYYLNSPTGEGQITPIYSEDVEFGLDFLVGLGSGIESFVIEGYTFAQQWRLNTPTGTKYANGSAYTVSHYDISTATINFYADWQELGFIMSLNYGLGDTVYDREHNPIDKIIFKTRDNVGMAIARANKDYLDINGQSVPLTQLPVSPPIYVKKKHKNDDEYPYTNKGWYFTSTIGEGSAKITNATALNISSNITIYQVFEPKSYNVTAMIDNTEFAQSKVPYNTPVVLPTPYKYHYEFKGWYLDKGFSQKFNGVMPPRSIVLYAKFEEV